MIAVVPVTSLHTLLRLLINSGSRGRMLGLFHPFQPIKEPMARTQGYPPCLLVENRLRVLDAAKVSDETMLTRPCVGRHPPA